MSKISTRSTNGATQPRPVDESGYELDEWGLPISGPRRRSMLAQLSRRDPRQFPEDWSGEDADLVRKVRKSILGLEADAASSENMKETDNG